MPPSRPGSAPPPKALLNAPPPKALLTAPPPKALLTAPPLKALLTAPPLLALLLTAGCGPPPEPPDTPTPPVPPTAPTGSPPPTFPAGPPTGGSGLPTGGFNDQFAIDCAGEPDGDAMIAVLRAEGVLDADADAEVTVGPQCAGSWQYAVVSVPELDPLQVVTQGEPDDLELVTAGTDVCTPEVRIQAPQGIRTAAACGI